jgi:hypothetical protein
MSGVMIVVAVGTNFNRYLDCNDDHHWSYARVGLSSIDALSFFFAIRPTSEGGQAAGRLW